MRLIKILNVDKRFGNKLKVVKFLKESKDLDLKETVDLVDSAPIIIFNNLLIAEAEEVVNKLTELGAVCDIVEEKDED